MLKKILVMLVLLTAIFFPAELRASDYNPYADSVPIPQTKENKPAPTQSEPKKDPTPKKKPAPKKPTPKKRISKPAKKNTENVSKTPKSRNYSSEKAHLRAIAKEAIKESREEKGREAAKKSLEAHRKKVEEDIQKEREVRQRKAQEEKKRKLKEEFEQARLVLTDWDFNNMRVKLRDNQKGKFYHLELEYNPLNGGFSFKSKRKNNVTADKMKTIVASEEVIEEELLNNKYVYFIIPLGWELRIYQKKSYRLVCPVFDFNTGDYAIEEKKQGYIAYQSDSLVKCWHLKYLPHYFSLHKASQ